MKSDEHYMRLALKQAEKAAVIGEVPIGCVIVCDGVIVGRGYNKRNKNKTTLAHAEMIAIDKASKKLGDWRLEGLYDVRDARTLPDVLWRTGAVPD